MRGDELHSRYEKEYSSWKNMKSRSKKQGCSVAPEFQRFEDFLRHMGQIPGEGYTLDRIVSGGEYSPSNCRWASKRDQANNRSNTIMIMYEGEQTPIAEVARRTDQSVETLRKRKSRGYTDEEVVRGRPKSASSQRMSYRKGGRSSYSDVPPLIRILVEPVDGRKEARWLGADERIELWLSFYYGSDNIGVAEVPWNEDNLDFTDFVSFHAERGAQGIAAGDYSGVLPPFKQYEFADTVERNEAVEKLLYVSELAFAELARREHSKDALVTPSGTTSIELSWLYFGNEGVNFPALRSTVRAFESSGLPLPVPLDRYWQQHRTRWLK